jgi:two-component system, sporulation sensor kinase E
MLDLASSESKFRGLIENAEHLIYVLDHEARMIYANPALMRLLGRDPGTTCDGGTTIAELVHADDVQRVAEAVEATLAGETIRALELRMVHADGETSRWFSQTSVPLTGEAGEVTERRETQVRAAHAERLADLGRIAAQIAHEIRNPLGAIINSINLLKRPGIGPDRRLLDIVSEEADRLNGIVSEFLMFARPPTRAAIPCDCAELVRSTVELFRKQHGGEEGAPDGGTDSRIGITCTVSAPVVPDVLADPNQFRQVLWNLLSNAAEALTCGGRVHVDVAASRRPGFVRISVTDNGPGVEDPSSVFQPFYTTKGHGTGLGLAIVARIIDDHGGRVSVRNLPAGGARFSIEIPVAEEAAAAVAKLVS